MTTAPEATLADVLADTEGTDLQPFSGFGGLHGGLLAARLLRRMRSGVPAELVPIEVSAHFLRAATERLHIETEVLRPGRAMSVVAASAETRGRSIASAVAVLASPRPTSTPLMAPAPPEALLPLSEASRFTIPPELVPISTRMEIRPATSALPFSGSPRPELCAWIRLVDPVSDPWERLLVLADALAPSYAAVLTTIASVPTIRMTLRFAPEVGVTEFDWVLVEAVTVDAGSDGWLNEVIHIWTPDAKALATSSQLRLVRT